jgi:crotonobetainyl-CoA:carnitine CoA-transferase CaiB-like acyl-CoA transferase
MSAPLSDIKVLDFSTLLPGPMATLLLAEAGAEVIKIERPGQGDEMRTYVPRWGSTSINFAMLNRGKKSIAIDLKSPEERELLKPLLEETDVIVEQFRPGVMDRLGLGFEQIRKINPDIIYCSITGYGQSGPKRDVAGHDLNYIGDVGLLALSSGPLEQPVVPPALIADIAAGTYPAIMNILLALRERDKSGKPAYLDIAMTDNLFPFMYWAIGNGVGANMWPGNADALVTGGSPRYQIYPTKDDRLLAAAPLEPKFWQTFCEAIGLEPSLRDDSRDPAATRDEVSRIIRSRTSTEWASVFAVADCCCSIVKTIEQALADPHFAARGLFDKRITEGDQAPLTALPVPIVPTMRKGGSDAGFPALGADNPAILEQAGALPTANIS